MFRKPRDGVSNGADYAQLPSVGRPPSPLQPKDMNMNGASPPSMTTKTLAQTAPPSLGRGKSDSTILRNGRTKASNNGSILSFFKKADSNTDASLFLPGAIAPSTGLTGESNGGISSPSPKPQHGDYETRFQEHGGSVKRRKLSPSPTRRTSPSSTSKNEATGGPDREACSPPPTDFNDECIPAGDGGGTSAAGVAVNGRTRHGPFVEDSDSDDDMPSAAIPEHIADTGKPTEEPLENKDTIFSRNEQIDDQEVQEEVDEAVKHMQPSRLKHESTSWPEQNEFADMENMGDVDDEYEDGEEYVERRWVQEQNRLELEAYRESETNGVGDLGHEAEIKHEDVNDEAPMPPVEDTSTSDVASCPMCGGSFAGITDAEASVHVNHCLDGNPTPLPSASTKPTTDTNPATNSSDANSATSKATNFRQPPPRPPKPGQRNPFQFASTSTSKPTDSTRQTSSAFSTLMSSHTEEIAWAAAAAHERSSHGKPSYQRTCPFYKIMPGLSICVDAFRYGAVSGCNAYFLSHFHSDHYVGLTASWCHGPIYCSGVTSRLVKQQLRVAAKWVVELEFDKRVVLPGTPGVNVTMIPANHCPGSSLYLFENEIPPPKNQPNAQSKTHRILHCGDFRACPAHLEHPLLAPEVIDNVTGNLRQQKIDVCYLDTTYLNPKYAFPSQEDVIQACADMCVSLNKEEIDTNDCFEQAKRARMGASMEKFMRKDSEAARTSSPDSTVVKTEDTPSTAPTTTTTITTTKKKKKKNPTRRGRLLIITGTYSIGKERICLGIARALHSLIYAPPAKQRIIAALRDPELSRLMTNDPLAAQVHMTPLFEIRADTLADYLAQYPPGSFSRVVGFRPSGWNYRHPGGRSADAPAVDKVLWSEGWQSRFGVGDLVAQRGSSRDSMCFGVPYSEHSSFRELAMFVCGLRIGRVVPTVNVGAVKGRERMRAWCDRWEAEKRKCGLFRVKGRPVKCEDGDGVVKMGGVENVGGNARVVKTNEDGEEVDEQGRRLGTWYPGLGTWELRTTL